MSEIVRGINEKCLLCHKKFSIFFQQHICKRCLRSVCKDCGENKANIYQKNQLKKPHRICKTCIVQYNFLDNYKLLYKLSPLGKNTDIGNLWLKQIRKFVIKENTKVKKQKIKSRTEFWQSLNFSLRNFFGIFIEGVQYYNMMKGIFQKSTKNVSQYACFFFIIHTTQANSIEMLNIIYNFMQQNPHSIQRVIQHLKYLGCRNNQITKLKPFAEYIIKRFMKNLSLNILTAQASLYIISNMINGKNIQVLEKGLATAMHVIKDFILQNYDKPAEIQKQLVLNVRYTQFEGFMKILAQKKQKESDEEYNKNRNNSESQSMSQRRPSDLLIGDEGFLNRGESYIQLIDAEIQANKLSELQTIEKQLKDLDEEIKEEQQLKQEQMFKQQGLKQNIMDNSEEDQIQKQIKALLNQNDKLKKYNLKLKKIGELILKQMETI